MRKAYRASSLDTRVRAERTTREAQALNSARRAGARTPTLLGINPDEYSIVMTFIKGSLARDMLDLLNRDVTRPVLEHLGYQVGLLHESGMAHGDLTTSNVIVDSGLQTTIIDFGMSFHTEEVEDLGVDIHLLERSVTASHALDSESCLRAVSRGYAGSVGPERTRLVMKQAGTITRRGRYFALR